MIIVRNIWTHSSPHPPARPTSRNVACSALPLSACDTHKLCCCFSKTRMTSSLISKTKQRKLTRNGSSCSAHVCGSRSTNKHESSALCALKNSKILISLVKVDRQLGFYIVDD